MFQPEHFAQCSSWNISAICSDWNIQPSVPTGTLEAVLRLPYAPFIELQHSGCDQCSNRNIQAVRPNLHHEKLRECSHRNIGRVLHTIQLPDGNSTLHSKHESHYSANSSGSSTIYGTRHRCCQSEGRRGQDYDCHQPSRVLRGVRSEHTAQR